jgi:hypothetical protein
MAPGDETLTTLVVGRGDVVTGGRGTLGSVVIRRHLL